MTICEIMSYLKILNRFLTHNRQFVIYVRNYNATFDSALLGVLP